MAAMLSRSLLQLTITALLQLVLPKQVVSSLLLGCRESRPVRPGVARTGQEGAGARGGGGGGGWWTAAPTPTEF